MIKKKSLTLLLFLTVISIKSQERKKSIFSIKKIGFIYNSASANNFLFNDKDYKYTTNTYKFQSIYDIGKWKNFEFQLIVQPQLQIIKHQLLNEQFVLPSEENYEEKRTEYTTLKTIHLYAFELGFIIQRRIIQKLKIQASIGLGVASINKRTERLAKGFTFIENGAFGFSYQTSVKTFLYVGGNVGHVSNLNFKLPNSGFNILGYEIGFSYIL